MKLNYLLERNYCNYAACYILENKVCCGPEIEKPGISRHIDIGESMDKCCLGGERFMFYLLNNRSMK